MNRNNIFPYYIVGIAFITLLASGLASAERLSRVQSDYMTKSQFSSDMKAAFSKIMKQSENLFDTNKFNISYHVDSNSIKLEKVEFENQGCALAIKNPFNKIPKVFDISAHAPPNITLVYDFTSGVRVDGNKSDNNRFVNFYPTKKSSKIHFQFAMKGQKDRTRHNTRQIQKMLNNLANNCSNLDPALNSTLLFGYKTDQLINQTNLLIN